jgi:hypothetical protein
MSVTGSSTSSRRARAPSWLPPTSLRVVSVCVPRSPQNSHPASGYPPWALVQHQRVLCFTLCLGASRLRELAWPRVHNGLAWAAPRILGDVAETVSLSAAPVILLLYLRMCLSGYKRGVGIDLTLIKLVSPKIPKAQGPGALDLPGIYRNGQPICQGGEYSRAGSRNILKTSRVLHHPLLAGSLLYMHVQAWCCRC